MPPAPPPPPVASQGEAEYLVSLFQFMRLLGYPASKISILTTYNGQAALLRDVVERRCAYHPMFGRPHKVCSAGQGLTRGGHPPGGGGAGAEGGIGRWTGGGACSQACGGDGSSVPTSQLCAWPACCPQIATVDKYQGQQNDFILLSLVRSRRVGHLRDVRRLVVALSRARLGLYVFGRASLFGDCYELAPAMKQLLARPTQVRQPGGLQQGRLARARPFSLRTRVRCRGLAMRPLGMGASGWGGARQEQAVTLNALPSLAAF